MSLQAYQQAAERAEQPRDSEYRLFGEVTRALMDAAERPADDFTGRVKALDWNRRLWMTLAADCARPNNALAPDLRAQIARRSALRRLPEAEDVAAAVDYLLSEKARNITGTTVTVDAGNTA